MEQFQNQIVEVKATQKEHDTRLDLLEKEIIHVKADIRSTNTRVDSLEATLKEISDNTKWIKRTITKAGVSAGFTIVVALLIALVAFYFRSIGG